jgi:hypothetical protein
MGIPMPAVSFGPSAMPRWTINDSPEKTFSAIEISRVPNHDGHHSCVENVMIGEIINEIEI